MAAGSFVDVVTLASEVLGEGVGLIARAPKVAQKAAGCDSFAAAWVVACRAADADPDAWE